METTCVEHRLMTLSPCGSRRVPLYLVVERGYLRLQVATEYDVSTSTSHVGSNSHDARTTGWAMISASCSWYFALSTLWSMPALLK
jgi:hypothetical protein